MTQPFSERVGGPAWRAEAVAWIEERVAVAGRRITGEVEQPRIRPWSTQLIVPTDAGRLWFKAGCAAQTFEPGLQQVLADLVPDAFDRPFATDLDRGWMLTVDRGEVWGEQQEPSSDAWAGVVRRTAEIQRAVAGSGRALLATGLPDCSPSTVVDRFDGLVDELDAAADIRASRPRVVDAVARLTESPIPPSWQHGDLHPWNVFAVDGALRLFDLGDAQWAHPIEVLRVPHAFVEDTAELTWRPIAEAWADVWDLTWDDLSDEWEAAGVTHAVNRCDTWVACLAEASSEELQEWGDAPLHHLRRVLPQ